MWTWKAPHGEQVVFKGWWPVPRCPCSLLLACWQNGLPVMLSSALPPCWQRRCIIYFLSPDFHPKANLLANEFQWLCSLGKDKWWRAVRTFLPLDLRRFPGRSLGRQGQGRGRWREKQPPAVPSAGSQLGFQWAALGNGTRSWLWFWFCCVKNCKAAFSESALERL